MAIAANKVRGVRAAVGMVQDAVALTRQHNDANVLTLGARFTDPETAQSLVKTFLETPFEAGRHERRVAKISGLEKAL
jgi:ribose 5-phosphate isomerase B